MQHISEINRQLMRYELLAVSINTAPRCSVNTGFYFNRLYPFMGILTEQWYSLRQK